MQTPFVAELRAGARPSNHAASLQRLPQPVAAAGGRRPRRRRKPLRRGHRIRGGRQARGDPLGTGYGSDPGVGRDAARARRLPSVVLRRLARLTWTRRSAARCDRTSGTAVRRSCATERRTCAPRGRARSCPDGGRPGRPAGARGRPRPRRSERDLVHRVSPRLFVDRRPVRDGATDGYPVQYRGVVESSPGLYFVGLLFLHSFTSMLIAGTGRDAERVAKHIAARPARAEAPVTSIASMAEQVTS